MFIRASAFWVIFCLHPFSVSVAKERASWVGGARKPDGSGSCLVFIPDNRRGWAPVAPAHHQHAPSGKHHLTPESIETVKEALAAASLAPREQI